MARKTLEMSTKTKKRNFCSRKGAYVVRRVANRDTEVDKSSKLTNMAGKNRATSFRGLLQKGDFNLRNYDRFSSEKNLLTLSEAFEFSQSSRTVESTLGT